ncbi:MAG: 30S ribosomal protein S12 methylthiotransferase RimO [Ignavibacteria bacterium]|nr:30S ribosomal protein S12 methylthiotransferase RimO [Ignavibacteria bacterium]
MIKKEQKIKIITLGCHKNFVDSEQLATLIENKKAKIIHSGQYADVLIINTCGFIEDAKKESLEEIFKAIEAKKEGKIKKIFVIGCLSQRYKKELKQQIPEIDNFFGVTSREKNLKEIIKSLNLEYRENLIGERNPVPRNHFAFLKISDGCNNPCSFCAIPLIKGKYKSKPLRKIIYEAESLVNKGVKEIILIAQDTTYWGLDLYGKRKLATLLNKLSKINGVEWIRIMYTYPARFPLDIIEVIKDNSNICKYIDIPIQHISDKILKSMRRGITKKGTIKLLETIKNKIPDICLRTTVIVGYPLETEKEYKELYEFIKQFKFNRLGVFTYSKEENTLAYKLKDTVPQKEKVLRQESIYKLQKEISLNLNKNLIGKSLKVLIDSKSAETYIGRTYMDAPEVDQEVYVSSAKKLTIGNFYNVLIKDAEEYDLFGDT